MTELRAKSLHLHIPLRESLQYKLVLLQSMWREIDQIHPATISKAEDEQRQRTLDDIETASKSLERLLQINAGKPSTEWR
jgi:hypothetical protein